MVNGEGNADNEGMKELIQDWLSLNNIETAKGKSRNEIFQIFGNAFEVIGSISEEYLKYFGENVTDKSVYSGKGYFIDHAVNHHPEVATEEYLKIPEILSSPDEVKLDDRKPGRVSLVFIKKYQKYGTAIVSVDATAGKKLLVHKSFFNPKKSPYPNLKRVQAFTPDDATSSISQPDNADPGGRRISTLGNTKLLNAPCPHR